MIVALHPSDELYGADRVLLRVVAEVGQHEPVAVWLPEDIDYPERALSRELAAIGVPVERGPLPVLRRANMNAAGVGRLAGQEVGLYQWLRRVRPDRLYVNTTALAPALVPARALRIPATLHVHETFGPTERRLIGPLLPLAERIVVVSEAARSALPLRVQDRAQVDRHTIEPLTLPAPAEAAALRRSFGIPLDCPVILLASRWTPGKGGRVALEALARTNRPDLRVVVLGGLPPSGTGEDLAQLAAASPVTEQVVIVGEVRDILPWLAAADAVALPSVAADSYPTLALEALAAGVPVLASGIGGLPEIVRGPGHGQLLPPGDVAAWARAFAGVTLRDHGSAGPAHDL